jgi:hypothetical protein
MEAPVQVISFYKPKVPPSGPPSAGHRETMDAFMAEMAAKGHFVAGGGMLPGAGVMNVSLAKGAFEVNEGASLIPRGFGGFGILRARSKEEMVDVVRRVLEIAGDGECVVHPLMDGPPE